MIQRNLNIINKSLALAELDEQLVQLQKLLDTSENDFERNMLIDAIMDIESYKVTVNFYFQQ
jgi:hypothetical protein